MDMEKKIYHKITVADLAPHVHSFLPNENKTEKLFVWLKNWIKLSLECGKVHPYYLLPSKADLAYHIGVSQGTMQNVFRLLEDEGIVESKQRIGTFIKDNKENVGLEKLTSKRELAIEIVKKYILENNYQASDVLVSTRKLALMLGISNTTLRLAFLNLVKQGILKKQGSNFVLLDKYYEVNKITTKTLVEKIAESLKEYIYSNYKHGEKLATNSFLSKKFKVSTKTIHDAVRLLVKEGLLFSRRGQYGTIVVFGDKKDSEISLYFYEKYEQKIRQYIIDNCQAGDKLPSIKSFSEKFETSQKTIKKALDNLMEEGYIAFSRGRYGGTFVLDIPQTTAEAYKWLAISSDYMSN